MTSPFSSSTTGKRRPRTSVMNGEKPVANWSPQLMLCIEPLGAVVLPAVTMPSSRRMQVGSNGVTLPLACSNPSK